MSEIRGRPARARPDLLPFFGLLLSGVAAALHLALIESRQACYSPYESLLAVVPPLQLVCDAIVAGFELTLVLVLLQWIGSPMAPTARNMGRRLISFVTASTLILTAVGFFFVAHPER